MTIYTWLEHELGLCWVFQVCRSEEKLLGAGAGLWPSFEVGSDQHPQCVKARMNKSEISLLSPSRLVCASESCVEMTRMESSFPQHLRGLDGSRQSSR
jgi:hypothetical protein